MNVSDMLRRITMAKAYEFLNRDPDQNIPRLVDWLERLDRNREITGPLSKMKKYADNPDSNWFRLAHSFWEDLDDTVRETLFTNFIGNDNLPSSPRLRENRKKYDCNIPWFILIDPVGPGQQELSFDELDAIVEQGKVLGTYFYGFSGREPLSRRNELIALGNKHADCVFLVFTAGSEVDEDLAGDLLRVRNMVPVINATEFAVSAGTGREGSLARAMAILQAARLLFGVSCITDRDNCQALGSEQFFDKMIAGGAKFAWFFTYLPMGIQGDPARMITAEQREYLYRQVRQFRNNKPLFTMDFWNDGEYMGGCVAGGRRYCHINANGDIEPCVFTPYSDSNIRSKSLLEAYRSPLFLSYCRRQLLPTNPLCSCPLLDAPDQLRELVRDVQARPTDLETPEEVERLTGKCEEASRAWCPVATRLWEKSRQG